MGNNNDRFTMHRPDLGGNMGYSLNEVEQILKDTAYDSGHKCLLCGGSADYRIIPKDNKFLTAEIQDKGYICNYCLSMNKLDRNIYGIREMK